uniref:DUF1640 domain-containing protein n=1 Tax=Candidatus Kentrum sp. DK TaxID=2126562 RepID=A0A450RVB2_9GAMM|nr:MAG: hypothetical protein BECKDK2373B_GA0170837_100439 [Candidatus Kentron sp. DK]VFJ60510.1 MAG: hypothetical protein BECKDK2373C_GA0170839_10823 [Candidatus Kentron sp. DK]
MTAITFDTLKFTKRLTGAGANPELAEATAKAFGEAQGELDLATRTDIRTLMAELREIRTEIKMLHERIDSTRWMLLILTIAVIAPQLKGFFS